MKKVSMLGATTLAGTLLFTGVGHQAHAAESEVNADNAIDIGSAVSKANGGEPENVNYDKPEDKGDYYFISYGNKSGYGTGGVRVYKNGTVESSSGAPASRDTGEFDRDGKYEFASDLQSNQMNSQNQSLESNNQNKQQTLKKNDQSGQQPQSQSKALPETGQEDINGGLVTIIAAVLLAVGSLLTFKHFSKSNK